MWPPAKPQAPVTMAVGVERMSVTAGRTVFFAGAFFFEAAFAAGFFAGAGLETGIAGVFIAEAGLGFAAGLGAAFAAVFFDVLFATDFGAVFAPAVFFVVAFFAMFPASGFAIWRTRRARRRINALYLNGRA